MRVSGRTYSILSRQFALKPVDITSKQVGLDGTLSLRKKQPSATHLPSRLPLEPSAAFPTNGLGAPAGVVSCFIAEADSLSDQGNPFVPLVCADIPAGTMRQCHAEVESAMSNEERQDHCRVCGKRLEPFKCAKCNGSGRVRFAPSCSPLCEACGGTGTVHSCPDLLKHLRKNRKLPGLLDEPLGGGVSSPARKTCPTCRGTRGIRHPVYGNIGCPRCGGRGWV